MALAKEELKSLGFEDFGEKHPNYGHTTGRTFSIPGTVPDLNYDFKTKTFIVGPRPFIKIKCGDVEKLNRLVKEWRKF